ncbi:hypothetical protein EUGRSUZ_L01792 [Eucalyptus grandis]|uniref:Uncharacterized protein n=1 Tax=Eucalyptus grandis TaxID=71139 RepID=A0A058ZUE7_EUCGR|nr:hypothetical protein EUGRSUZ_L01792 [Eucalyptus grandis]
MDFASPLLELVKELWGLASRPLGYIYNLKDNVNSLKSATEDKKSARDDVKARVEHEEEEARALRTKQVENWLGKVQEFGGRADEVLREAQERDQIKCFCRCLPPNGWSSYKLGKRVNQMLNEVRELQPKEGEFHGVTSPLPPPQVLKMHMENTVGLDISLTEVWKWLVDEKQVGVIRLYGTGGVGKTTLMKRINEELSRANHGFDVVIWVVVSKQVNEDSIRNTIRKRLNIEDKCWEGWSQDERVDHLWEVLAKKKFVLLRDDVWVRLDLSKIGVPCHNGSKVVFTTRLKQVCHLMQANKTLAKNVNKSLVDCHPEIQDLAKDIDVECKGLPLALVTVGRAMAGKDDPIEWRHALTTLRNKPHKLPGMEEEVYDILKFSYDSLNDATLQACFLYCCLFPEDYPILANELIELWIGEGLLGDIDDVYHMPDKGASVLGDLKRACLLESELYPVGQSPVKMHDVIRDMAAWIARDYGRRENKLLVIAKEEDMFTEMISKWGELEKACLWGEWIVNINQTPSMYSPFKTLFVRQTKVRLMPRGVFNSMTAHLMMLDLSDNRNIELFPEGICDLINLYELPREIKNLTRLRSLLLNYTSETFLIPTRAIASLPLIVFNMWPSHLEKEEEMVEELGRMQDLTDLSIRVFKLFSTLKISQSFRRCIRRMLYLNYCPILVKMEITQEIGRAPNCFCFPNLVEIELCGCGFLDLSWLVHAPKLQRIAREELVASRLFSRLQYLFVDDLPKLKNICDHTLSLKGWNSK